VTNNDTIQTNLNVAAHQTTRRGVPEGQDINKMRDKFFNQNNKQDHEAMPNNTFQKLFNNANGPS
jgi:hypothetical protein